ncbi:threonine/serine exporter family protein [Clostridiaceae bacterium 35-E11]
MILSQFVFSFLATIGFAVLFNIPKNTIIKASFGGAIGWSAFIYSKMLLHSPVFATFIGALVVAGISEIFARKFKEAVTVFVIPGILPLVPGVGTYYTMIAMIENDLYKSARIGTETIFIAGSIAAAILIVSSFMRMLVQLKKTVIKKS